MDSSTHSPPKNGALTRAGALQAKYDRLWMEYRQAPDAEHRNRLVEAYQPLVASIVRRFALRLPRSVDRGDLGTAANVGLMGAIGAFDQERGVPFELYCEVRVRGALRDELRHQDWLPRPWRERIERQKRASEEVRTRFGREAGDSEVAEEMGLELPEYQQLFGSGLLNAPSGSSSGVMEGDGLGLLEEVCDPSTEPPADRLNRDEILALIAERLSDQEYRVVYLRYWEELSMREIGELAGLSESRVCKIHARLLERLRERFSDEG